MAKEELVSGVSRMPERKPARRRVKSDSVVVRDLGLGRYVWIGEFGVRIGAVCVGRYIVTLSFSAIQSPWLLYDKTQPLTQEERPNDGRHDLPVLIVDDEFTSLERFEPVVPERVS